MLKPNTVFVLGAAVSAEWGFPLGAGLLDAIGRRLPANNSQITWEDRFIEAASNLGDDWFPTAVKLRNGLQYAASIDNFIEHRSDNALMVRIAKLAISAVIGDCERNMGTPQTEGTTYRELFRLMVGSLSHRDIPAALSRVGIITFNYDRSLEIYLRRALMEYSGYEREAAHALVSGMRIQHAYGQLGPLPDSLEGHKQSPQVSSLREAADGIRTFSEETESGSAAALKQMVGSADHLIFLGCAHHPRNMILLAPTEPTTFKSVFGTQILRPPAGPDWADSPSVAKFSAPAAEAFAGEIYRWQDLSDPHKRLARAGMHIEPLTALQLVGKYGSSWVD